MNTNIIAPIIKPAEGHQTISQEEFLDHLSELTTQWRESHEQGLELRYPTGKLLNSHLGPPTKRQKRGEEVVKSTAEKLGITVGELSRMRWLAFHFSSTDEMKSKHPQVKTWTDCKALLPTLRAKKPRAGKKTPSAVLAEVQEQAKAFSTGVNKVKDDLTEERRKELAEQLRLLVEAAGKCLKLHVTVEEVLASAISADGEVAKASTPVAKE